MTYAQKPHSLTDYVVGGGAGLLAALPLGGCENEQTPSGLEKLASPAMVSEAENPVGGLDLRTPEGVFNLYWTALGRQDKETLRLICTPEWYKNMPDSAEELNELAAEVRSSKYIIKRKKNIGDTTILIHDSVTPKGTSSHEKFELRRVGDKYLVNADG